MHDFTIDPPTGGVEDIDRAIVTKIYSKLMPLILNSCVSIFLKSY
jgi:hypothetical protein